MDFTKTIRFKLTIWYSLLVFFFCGFFILSINLLLEDYFQRESLLHTPRRYFIQRIEETVPGSQFFNTLDDESIGFLKQARLNDLDNIRKVSLYSLIPLTVLSFGSGYLISGQMLKPLIDLNEEIKKKSMKNFKEKIYFDDTGDEISELIKSFNKMSLRLGKTFDSQKEFVENASHELKTPLAIIQANIDAALEDNKLTEEELRTVLKESKRSVNFMNKLTEDLLLLSILDVGIEMSSININDVLKKSVGSLEGMIQEKDINIDMRLDKKISKLDFKGNDILLERVFMNILENAIKYSDCKSIIVNNKVDKNEVLISIKDDGKGITKKDQKMIFERFYRIDKSRSRKSGGSGLGLAIVKKIIEVHEGDILIESKKGKGTEFVIVLPTRGS